MKKTFLLVVLLSLLLSLGVGVFAQSNDLPKAGTTPGSLFYFLDLLWEKIVLFFTFGDIKKAERHISLAAERLAEAKAVGEKGKPELVEKSLERYEDQLEKALLRTEKAETKEKDTKELAKTIAEATYKHLIVLNKALEESSEEAKSPIEQAMIASVKAHEKAIEILKTKDALGEISEKGSLPAEISEEIRERIQSEAQKELQIEEAVEKALQDFESVESLRDLCVEKGAPSEMCEKIPVKGFKSFKALEDFCTGMGGASETCESLEPMCKEVGVTTADECFYILTTAEATVSTQRASVESFEEIEANCLKGGEDPEVCASIEAECKEAGATTPNECVQYWFAKRSSLQIPEEERRIEEETSRGDVYLGAMYSTINAEMQAERGLLVNNGALLISIIPDSPAALAGLEEGDIIIEFNGESITQDNTLTEMLYRSGVGATVSLRVLRGEYVLAIDVKLAERPAD